MSTKKIKNKYFCIFCVGGLCNHTCVFINILNRMQNLLFGIERGIIKISFLLDKLKMRLNDKIIIQLIRIHRNYPVLSLKIVIQIL